MSLFKLCCTKLSQWLGESLDCESVLQAEPEEMDLDSLSLHIPYRLYDSQRRIYENKSSFGFVLETAPLLCATATAQQELATLIKEIGEDDANIQCLLFADPQIDSFLDAWSAPRSEKGGLFARLADKKCAFFKQQSARKFRFFFSYSLPKTKDVSLDLLVEKKQKALAAFSRITSVSDMEPDALLAFVSSLINFKDGPARPWNPHAFLSEQIGLPGTAIEVRSDSLTFHSQKEAHLFKSYEAIDVPQEWSLAHTAELLGDFFNPSYRIPSCFYIHYAIHFPSHEKKKTAFQGKLQLLEHQSKFPALFRLVPSLSKELQECDLVKRQLLDGEKLVETRLSCALFSKPDQMFKAESTLLALYQKFGFQLRENRFIHLPDFLSCLPMSWSEESAAIKGLKKLRCMRTTLTNETSHLIPCIGEWLGNSTTGTLLMGRKGQIAAWDPFATEGNLNTVVVGPSGSGKSVFMQEMIATHLGQGGRVFVLDLGRSFEKLCHLFSGEAIVFSEKSRLDLNPFRSLKTEEGLDLVTQIVATMISPHHTIDKAKADILSVLVKTAWEQKGSEATIDTLLLCIETMHFQSELMRGSAESIKEGLKKYSSNGLFGKFFQGSLSIDFSQDLVVIETEELKNTPDLQSVILQIFALAISNQIFLGDRSKRCLICIDEAWDLLKSPQMEGFIESLARRLRKYNGALVVGTQSVKDFERSFGAKAAFQNSNWLVLLGKDNDSINALKKDNLISMNAHMEAALQSLRMEKGHYAELFVYHKASGAGVVGQLKLDPFSQLLYSTKASEFQAVMDLHNQGLRIEEAIERLLS